MIGNSFGGWVALELARRGRASCVVAIAPSGLETPVKRSYVIALNELMRVRARLSIPLRPPALGLTDRAQCSSAGFAACPGAVSPKKGKATCRSSDPRGDSGHTSGGRREACA